MSDDERRASIESAITRAAGDADRRDGLVKLLDWLVLNAKGPKHRPRGFSVANMKALMKHIERRVRLPDGVSVDEAIAEFADEMGKDPRTVRRVYDETPEFSDLRASVLGLEMILDVIAKAQIAKSSVRKK
jgi:hypothetical protein